MPEGPSRIHPLTVVFLVAAAALLAIGIAFFATSHPRRGALFVALTVAFLIAAWFSIRRTRLR